MTTQPPQPKGNMDKVTNMIDDAVLSVITTSVTGTLGGLREAFQELADEMGADTAIPISVLIEMLDAAIVGVRAL